MKTNLDLHALETVMFISRLHCVITFVQTDRQRDDFNKRAHIYLFLLLLSRTEERWPTSTAPSARMPCMFARLSSTYFTVGVCSLSMWRKKPSQENQKEKKYISALRKHFYGAKFQKSLQLRAQGCCVFSFIFNHTACWYALMDLINSQKEFFFSLLKHFQKQNLFWLCKRVSEESISDLSLAGGANALSEDTHALLARTHAHTCLEWQFQIHKQI